MATFNTQPLPFPAKANPKTGNSDYSSYTVDQILQDLSVAAKNVAAGPVSTDSANANLYWELAEVRSGLLYAALVAGATPAQRQAANQPPGPHNK